MLVFYLNAISVLLGAGFVHFVQSVLHDTTTPKLAEGGLPENNGSCSENCDKAHGKCESWERFNRRFDESQSEQQLRRRNVGVYEGRVVCSCAPGYKGPACSTVCSRGYGAYCWKPCPPNCAADCDSNTGNCVAGCIDGFTGEKCSIAKENTTKLSSRTTSVKGDVKPRAEIKPLQQTQFVGFRVEFKCSATGIPEPDLEWTRANGEKLNPRSTFKNGIFTIPSVSPSDASVYLCTATNRAGDHQRKAYLDVKFGNETSASDGFLCEDCSTAEIKEACAENDRQISASMNAVVPPLPPVSGAVGVAEGAQQPQEKDPDGDSAEEFNEFDTYYVSTKKRIKTMKQQIKNLEREIANNRRCRDRYLAGNAFGLLCLCAFVYVFWRTMASIDKLLQTHQRHARQAGNSTQTEIIVIQITTSFQSNTTSKTAQIRPQFRKMLEDFSDEFHSEVMPGLKIKKNSIKLGPVTTIKKTPISSSYNRVQYDFLLYGGVCLMTVVLLALLVIYALKKRTGRMRRSRVERNMTLATWKETISQPGYSGSQRMRLFKYNAPTQTAQMQDQSSRKVINSFDQLRSSLPKKPGENTDMR